MTRSLPSYRNPFADQQQVSDLEQRYLQEDAKREYPDPVALSAGDDMRNRRGDLRGNLQKIFRWKLENFLTRFAWVRQFPDQATISNRQIEVAIDAALIAEPDGTYGDHQSSAGVR